MKVLVLGLDQTILKKTSLSFQRAEIYKKVLDKYFVLVPAASTEQVVISEGLQFFGFGGFLKIMKLVKIFFGAKKILQEEKFDVISTQDVYFLGFVGLILARLFSIGLEIQVHGWEKKGWGRLSLARFILKRANAIRVVSQRLKKELI